MRHAARRRRPRPGYARHPRPRCVFATPPLRHLPSHRRCRPLAASPTRDGYELCKRMLPAQIGTKCPLPPIRLLARTKCTNFVALLIGRNSASALVRIRVPAIHPGETRNREALDWPEEWADGAPSSSQSSSLVRRQPRRIVSGQRRGPIAVARWQAHSVGTVQRRAPSSQHPPRVSLERHGGAWNCAGESKGGLSVSRQRVVVRCVRHALLTLGCCAAQTRRGVLLGVTAPRSVLADSLAFRAPARLFRQMRQQSIERSDAGAYG